jgi:hypothetical protein
MKIVVVVVWALACLVYLAQALFRESDTYARIKQRFTATREE